VVDTRVKFRRKIVKNGEQKLPISEKIEIWRQFLLAAYCLCAPCWLLLAQRQKRL
jgi:hypothetical protein